MRLGLLAVTLSDCVPLRKLWNLLALVFFCFLIYPRSQLNKFSEVSSRANTLWMSPSGFSSFLTLPFKGASG